MIVGLHRDIMESLYRTANDHGETIDRWTAHFISDQFDVELSNRRHQDKARQKKEDIVWAKIIKDGDIILECGCGAGFFLQRLSKLFQKYVQTIGVDLSETALKEAMKRSPSSKIILASATQTCFANESIDVAITISFYEHVLGHRQIISEIKRILKPGGYLYITIHKNFIDPFVFPTLLKCVIKKIRRRNSINTLNSNKIDEYFKNQLLSLDQTRYEVSQALLEQGFNFVERKDLLCQFEWSFYKKITPFLLPYLLELSVFLNRLPFTYYKDLEYWVYRKPE